MDYQVIVIGGGHAGSEAALISARRGAKTALINFSNSTIGKMSCNPAIGGVGKGQLVKEIDALGGEMARAIDDTGIQFRILNSSKGPAARSSRAQADRDLYKDRVLKACLDVERETNRLSLIQDSVEELLVRDKQGAELRTSELVNAYGELAPQMIDAVCGVVLKSGREVRANAVVITTGTFLKALMHTGEEKKEGGRIGEDAAYSLSDSIKSLGLRMGRMKTGTPPRLSLKSIDLSMTEAQPGDDPIKPFSFFTESIERKQIDCYITHTSKEAHQIIADNFYRSPMFNGQIESRGPRYCPSIEDKIFRFKDKESHHVFIEPEGFDSDIVYPNGISTSLPTDVQERFVRAIPGFSNVEFLEWGYAVEYDHIDPTELDRRLAVRSIKGLFAAGQINGTSGYEEAGAQGLIAGMNAALEVLGEEPFIVRRDEGYIGVMIDDLITLGVMEPYRMFTSRAEFRLHLREDNADLRLTPKARKAGFFSSSYGDKYWEKFEERSRIVNLEVSRLNRTRINPTEKHNQLMEGLGSAKLFDSITLSNLMRRPEITYPLILEHFPPTLGDSLDKTSFEEADKDQKPEYLDNLTPLLQTRIETEIKFEGYLKRQQEDIDRVRKMEDQLIPEDLNYDDIKGLSNEVKERLKARKPATLGQASRLYGITPAAVSLIAICLRKELS